MAESPLPSLTETDPALTARFALSAKTSESQQRALTLCRKHLANSALPADKRAGVQIAAGRCAYELALNEPNQDVKTKLFQEVVDLLGPLAAQGSFLSAPGRNSVLLRLAAAQANLGRHTETLEALDKLQFSASLGAREAAEQKDAEALRIYAQGKIAAKQV
ncbi:MAG TPA: hypothetical protein PLP17_04320, partial [Oligoflexia bacterium]|nr:hypothetical protein [Oligoflexia bacterium]